MVLKEECRNLDLTKMNRDYKYLRTTGGITPVMGKKYYPCNEKGWIHDCPEDCNFYMTE